MLIGKWKNNIPNQFPKTSEIGLRLSDNKNTKLKLFSLKIKLRILSAPHNQSGAGKKSLSKKQMGGSGAATKMLIFGFFLKTLTVLFI